MAREVIHDPAEESGSCTPGTTAESPRLTGAGKQIEATDETTKHLTRTKFPCQEDSQQPMEQDTRLSGAHNDTQDHEEALYETQQVRDLMTSPSVAHGEWQSMPFEGEIEKVFVWNLGDDTEGMPATDTAESLILVDGEEPEDMLDDSVSRLEWLRQKRDNGEQNEHLDQLMTMIGHEEVKEHFLAVKERAAIARKWNEDPRSLKLNLVLYEGQAIVAERIAYLYSKFLFSVGVIPRIHFERRHWWIMPINTGDRCLTVCFCCPWDEIKGNRSAHKNNVIEVVHIARGKDTKEESGSDTTSEDSTMDNTYENQQIQNIIQVTQNSQDHVVFVLFLNKLDRKYSRALKFNLEARREFPEKVCLDEYDEPEFVQLLVEGGFEDPSLRVLVKRVLRRHQDSSTSSKIHAIESELDAVCYRCEQRQEQEYLRWARSHVPGDEIHNGSRPTWPKKEALIKRKDIFGPEPKDVQDKSEAWRELQQLIGLESVKMHISQLFKRAKINYRREIRGLDPLPENLNRVFVGEPGVGKTTVAKLYAAILSELDLLSEGDAFITDPSHLIAAHIGDSELQTKEALDAAMGNMLCIDNADMLYHSSGHGTSDTDPFRVGMIDTIVANVSGEPGEDRCVVLTGCKDRMEEMFLNSNPGLQRRFPIEDALHFENYNIDQLCQILDLKVAKYGNTQLSEHAKQVSREVLSRMSERPKFGNAGDVENLLARAKMRNAERREAASGTNEDCDEESYIVTLQAEDFDPDYDRASRADQNRDFLFSGFVGFEKIVNQFRQYQLMADGMRKHQIDPRAHIPWAFVFKGPPGTGKTSTARKVGKLFYDIGLLSSDEVVVCSASDLVGEYQGHTGPKVINMFESSLGKVLFIDEAYRLTAERGRGSGNFTNQAVGELVDAMTKPRYAGKMVVVLAGYTEDMEELLQSNPGIRSRFPTHLEFPSMTPKQCVQHLRHELGKLMIDITGGHSDRAAVEKWNNIHKMLAKLGETKGWANGRDIETLAKALIVHVFVKAGTGSKAGAQARKAPLKVSLDELTRSLQHLLREREGFPNGREHLAEPLNY